MTESEFALFQNASEMFGVAYASHVAAIGLTISQYQKEQEEKLVNLFREKVQARWQERYGNSLTEAQLDSLEKCFNQNFRATLALANFL